MSVALCFLAQGLSQQRGGGVVLSRGERGGKYQKRKNGAFKIAAAAAAILSSSPLPAAAGHFDKVVVAHYVKSQTHQSPDHCFHKVELYADFIMSAGSSD
jgi:hypothetical protein